MPTKEGEELMNGAMYIKDQDGEIVPIPREIPEITVLSDPEGNMPPVELMPAQSFIVEGKTAMQMLKMIIHDLNVLDRRKRAMARKKEQYRRACLKYPDGDRKRELAYLMYQVAIERYVLYKEGGRYNGNA